MATVTMGRTLLDKGHEIQETYQTVLEQRAANRRSLRDLNVQGLLTEQESAEVLELYPPRKANGEDEVYED